jgi:hypothetical protein
VDAIQGQGLMPVEQELRCCVDDLVLGGDL